MKFVYFLLCLNLCTVHQLFGQKNLPITIEGNIIEKISGQPVPYAHIRNLRSNKITISNANGYFQIRISDLSDTLVVSFVGFKSYKLFFTSEKIKYTIALEAELQLLNEVSVVANDNSYLFDLLMICKRKAPEKEATSKAYFELKSYVNNDQVELLENFYNMDVAGYELKKLHLKAGRLALKPFGNRFFASMESTRAIAMQKIFYPNFYFPKTPLQLSKGKMKKHFYLSLDKKYILENGDSIYVVDYSPKQKSNEYFAGKIWINKSKSTFLKITSIIDKSARHPFLPIWTGDSIGHVDFNITKNFGEVNGNTVFKQIDFSYKIYYFSKIRKGHNSDYTVATQVILYSYDFKDQFFTPKFQFPEFLSDYKKISAIPVNDFFWNFNNEYRVKDQKKSNEVFFADEDALTSERLKSTNKYLTTRFFQHDYLEWNEKRLVFENRKKDDQNKFTTETTIKKYDLSIKIFMDVNTFGDSTQVITRTILDPYETFYAHEIDKQALCFINIYFDLCEIHRRKFDKIANEYNRNQPALDRLYDKLIKEIEAMKLAYTMEVDRGKVESKMRYWNQQVIDGLGIDNIEIYQLYKEY